MPIEDAVIVQLINLENDVKYQEYAGNFEPEFLHVPGTVPILISAPHGAKHLRDGENKEEDEYTAGLARLVGERTGAHVIYARRRSRTDPNFAMDAPYKKSLFQIAEENKIKFVLDLHGAKKDWDFGVALGTRYGKSCSDNERKKIIDSFARYKISENSKEKYRLDVDKKMPGFGNKDIETVIKFCQKKDISAAQIEINAWLRIPERREDSSNNEPFSGDKAMIENLVNALSDLVVSLSER